MSISVGEDVANAVTGSKNDAKSRDLYSRRWTVTGDNMRRRSRQRADSRRFEVDHPGDYATFNSYHPTDATGISGFLSLCLSAEALIRQSTLCRHRPERQGEC